MRLEGESIWLIQKQISQLFNTERSVIMKQINNIFNTDELSKDLVCANFAHTAEDSKTGLERVYRRYLRRNPERL